LTVVACSAACRNAVANHPVQPHIAACPGTFSAVASTHIFCGSDCARGQGRYIHSQCIAHAIMQRTSGCHDVHMEHFSRRGQSGMLSLLAPFSAAAHESRMQPAAGLCGLPRRQDIILARCACSCSTWCCHCWPTSAAVSTLRVLCFQAGALRCQRQLVVMPRLQLPPLAGLRTDST
jgi:hypothetical protein